MQTFTVRAVWQDRGWDVTVPDVGHARASSLARVDRVARSLISEAGHDADGVELELRAEVDGIEGEVRVVRKEIEELAASQVQVAAHSRAVARALREKGLTGADAAVVLGVSPQRVSQLNHS